MKGQQQTISVTTSLLWKPSSVLLKMELISLRMSLISILAKNMNDPAGTTLFSTGSVRSFLNLVKRTEAGDF